MSTYAVLSSMLACIDNPTRILCGCLLQLQGMTAHLSRRLRLHRDVLCLCSCIPASCACCMLRCLSVPIQPRHDARRQLNFVLLLLLLCCMRMMRTCRPPEQRERRVGACL